MPLCSSPVASSPVYTASSPSSLASSHPHPPPSPLQLLLLLLLLGNIT